MHEEWDQIWGEVETLSAIVVGANARRWDIEQMIDEIDKLHNVITGIWDDLQLYQQEINYYQEERTYLQ